MISEVEWVGRARDTNGKYGEDCLEGFRLNRVKLGKLVNAAVKLQGWGIYYYLRWRTGISMICLLAGEDRMFDTFIG